MIVSNLDLRSTPQGEELSADVTFEASPRETTRVWFLAAPDSPTPVVSGDPFFAAFYVPALYLGEDLHLDAAVTPELIRTASQRMAPILQRWYPRLRTARISSAGEFRLPAGAGAPDGVASTFSTGLDSWYTFLKRREELTHVLFCSGFDRSQPRECFYPRLVKSVRENAKRWDKIPLLLSSNVTRVGVDLVQARQIRNRGPFLATFHTDCYFVGQLVACAACFQDVLRRLYIASSHPYEFIRNTASNPLIDPTWSTPRLDIVHDGAEADRTAKLEFVYREDPRALQSLSVCHNLRSDGTNCGHCEKCLRTLMSLRLAGIGPDRASFTSPVNFATATRTWLSTVQRKFWEELLERARDRGDAEAACAIEKTLGRRFDLRRLGDRLRVLRRDLRSPKGRRDFRRGIKASVRERRARILRAI